jgi:hypothetical protein
VEEGRGDRSSGVGWEGWLSRAGSEFRTAEEGRRDSPSVFDGALMGWHRESQAKEADYCRRILRKAVRESKEKLREGDGIVGRSGREAQIARRSTQAGTPRLTPPRRSDRPLQIVGRGEMQVRKEGQDFVSILSRTAIGQRRSSAKETRWGPLQGWSHPRPSNCCRLQCGTSNPRLSGCPS